MENVLTILNKFYPKVVMKSGDNKLEGIYGNRHVAVSYNKGQDLFNIYAFTLNVNKSILPTKEVKVNDVFIGDLEKEIKSLIK